MYSIYAFAVVETEEIMTHYSPLFIPHYAPNFVTNCHYTWLDATVHHYLYYSRSFKLFAIHKISREFIAKSDEQWQIGVRIVTNDRNLVPNALQQCGTWIEFYGQCKTLTSTI